MDVLLLHIQRAVKTNIAAIYITILIFPRTGIQILCATKYKNTNIIVASIVSKILYMTFIRLTSFCKIIFRTSSRKLPI